MSETAPQKKTGNADRRPQRAPAPMWAVITAIIALGGAVIAGIVLFAPSPEPSSASTSAQNPPAPTPTYVNDFDSYTESQQAYLLAVKGLASDWAPEQSNETLIFYGDSSCARLAGGEDTQEIVAVYDDRMSFDSAQHVVKEAAENLCPAHKYKVRLEIEY